MQKIRKMRDIPINSKAIAKGNMKNAIQGFKALVVETKKTAVGRINQ